MDFWQYCAIIYIIVGFIFASFSYFFGVIDIKEKPLGAGMEFVLRVLLSMIIVFCWLPFILVGIFKIERIEE